MPDSLKTRGEVLSSENLFQDSLRTAKKQNYLGDFSVVSGLLMVGAGRVLAANTPDLMLDSIEKECKLLSRILLGNHPDYPGMRRWNEPGYIDVFCAKWLGSTEKIPSRIVEHAALRFYSDLLGLVRYAGIDGVLNEQWQWQFKTIVQRYAYYFLGMDTPSQAVLELTNPKTEGIDQDAGDSLDGIKCGGPGSGVPGPCPTGRSNTSGSLSKLSKAEKNAIEDYSTDKFQSINSELRSGALSKANKKIVAAVDSGLQKADKREGATIRSFDIPPGPEGDAVRNSLQPGKIYSDSAYLSTRKVPSVSDRVGFVDKKAPANRVILKVMGKSGVDISEVSKNPGEGEVLYPRGTRFNVIQSQHLPNGAILAIIEEEKR